MEGLPALIILTPRSNFLGSDCDMLSYHSRFRLRFLYAKNTSVGTNATFVLKPAAGWSCSLEVYDCKMMLACFKPPQLWLNPLRMCTLVNATCTYLSVCLSLSIYIYVFMYMHAYVCMYVWLYVSPYVCMCNSHDMYTCTYTEIWLCLWFCAGLQLNIWIGMCLSVSANVCKHT